MVLNVDVWQDFEGALDSSGLDANDHASGITWSVTNVNGKLSVGPAAEFGFAKRINGLPDPGTKGLIHNTDAGAGGSDAGYVQATFTGVDDMAAGFWIMVPSGLFQTWTTHAVSRIQDATDDRQLIVHVINDNANYYIAGYVWQQGATANIQIDHSTLYWVTIGFTRNVNPDGWKMRVYLPDGTQVGSEVTRISGNTQQLAMLLGNFGSGGALTGDTNFYFDDMVLKFGSGAYPLLPPPPPSFRPQAFIIG